MSPPKNLKTTGGKDELYIVLSQEVGIQIVLMLIIFGFNFYISVHVVCYSTNNNAIICLYCFKSWSK